MAVFAIVSKASKDKYDVFQYVSERIDANGDVVGYTLTLLGVDPVELDKKYRPVNAVDTARCCQIWTSNQSGWTKESRNTLRIHWSSCSAFMVNRVTKIAGHKNWGCSTPTTLAATVNSNKRGDIFSA
jgi:hypothetical protein